MSPGADLTELLGADWDAVETRAQEYLERGRARVVRWRWAPARAALEHPALLWAERDGQVPDVRLADARPADRSTKVAYGFDDAGHLLVSCRADRSGAVEDATTWVDAAGGCSVQLYFLRGVGGLQLARAAIPTYSEGRLVRLRMLYDPREQLGEQTEFYTYDEATGGLSKIVVDRLGPGSEDRRYTYDVVRAPDGDVALIRYTDGFDTAVVYRRRNANEVRAARKRVEQDMVELAIRWARRVLPRGSVRAIALVYGVDEQGLPPALAAATGPGAGSGEEHYHPAEFDVFDGDPSEFRDPAFREDCRVLSQEWRFTETESEPRATLVKVAKHLARQDWREVLGLGDPPVVFAVDEELEDLQRNLPASGSHPS